MDPTNMQKGHAYLFKSYPNHKSANPHILGLIPLSQICKSLRCFRRQVPNSTLFIFWLSRKSPICKFLWCSSPLIANLQIFHHRSMSVTPLMEKHRCQNLCRKCSLISILCTGFQGCCSPFIGTK
jgi:hypothetical protein